MAESKKVSFGVDPVTAFLGVALIGGGYIALKKIGELFGVVKSEDDKKADALRSADYMAPAYALNLQKQKKKFYGWPNQKAKAESIARAIYESKGVFNDDESKLMGALNQFTYKTQISIVAYYFLKLYKKDLAQFLSTFLSAPELSKLYTKFDKLPTGIV